MSDLKPELLAKLPALVIDQNRFMRALLADLLRQIGLMEVALAGSAQEALQSMRSWPPGVVFCELDLPPYSGVQILKWIRTSPDSRNPTIPIILIAAPTRREEVLAARDAGVTEFLAKPVTLAGIQSRLRSALSGRRKFVRATSYVGPCRRRRRDEYGGPMRRLEDPTAIDDNAVGLLTVMDADVTGLTELARRVDFGDRRQLREVCERCGRAVALAREAGDQPLAMAASALKDYIEAVGATEALDREVVFTHLAAMSRLISMTGASDTDRRGVLSQLRQDSEARRRAVGR